MVVLCFPAEMAYAAASSYTNAKEFFDSTGEKNGKHIDIYNGNIYFATQAKLSSSSSNLRYYTLGFDVTLTGNGKSVSFAVKRGGSLAEVPESGKKDGTYEYILYCISTNSIRTLARATKNTSVETVLAASNIEVRMDAIMTTLQNGTVHGGIVENGSGGITVTSNPVYRLKNSTDLSVMKDIFSGHDFKSYTNIAQPLDNCQLDIMYQLGAYTSLGSGYTTSSVTIGGQTLTNVLFQSNKVVTDSKKVLQTLTLRNPTTMGLKKTGYYLPSGAEWKKSNGVTYSATATYEPKDLHPEAGIRNLGIVLSANWKANPYTIYYDANGGMGAVAPSSMAYDTTAPLRANTFTRTGYRLKEGAEWNTKPDGTGTSYKSGDDVLNLTSEYNGKITLYANWEPCVYEITTDKHGGTGGTDAFYEKYNTGFYSTLDGTSGITSITTPSRTGYTFLGYFTSINGLGNMIVTNTGAINVVNTFFIRDALIHADWEANKYTVTFDKQGGEYGSDTAVATYDKSFPVADAPVRAGYTFKGYYTAKNGGGTQIYNENMASDTIYKYTNGVTLYAYWVDDILPQVELTVNINDWTNQKVTLTAEASDYGVGLKSLYIYRISENGSLITVASATALNGIKTKTLTFTNTQEGSIRYKAVVTDVNGCTAESYNTAYYDITAPTGTNIEVDVEDNVFTIELDITDINTGN